MDPIEQLRQVADKLDDDWPNDEVPGTKARRYAKEIRAAVRQLAPPPCRHDADGRCIHPAPWDMADDRRTFEKQNGGWLCRACRCVVVTEEQASSRPCR